MRVNQRLDRFRWWGRGPHENYSDRKESAELGLWSGTVNEQFVPYVRPQENGNKEEVRWLELTDGTGHGLRVENNNVKRRSPFPRSISPPPTSPSLAITTS